ncbi:DNA-binding domain-containing protein [Oceanimonas pelagia]|uniref:DNA-binding domain-containing protein n=1 Tax=Oceanimonas pelagia TaxID=3028314 RepID=A0AA50KPR5_9GAMM|nr:DNA-binding domain-containing protein [Oceanimonas pelagia]WMC10872.1 DNA-binding domain-containing protein [Oceanimonas pelagia]
MHNAFLHALLDPALPVPAGVAAHPGQRARFNVYRNNVRVSLTEALAALFPVCKQLVGDDFFNAMAGIYIEQSPPSSPLLTGYGDSLPAFIEGFAPANRLPWLADMARLELLVQRVQHAADTEPVTADRLQALLTDPERLARQGLQLTPACALLRSAFAVASIWLAHHGEGRLQEIRTATPENVLVLRIGLSVRLLRLADADATFIECLRAGAPLAAALEHSLQQQADFNPAAILQGLLEWRAVTGFITQGDAS